MAAGVRAVALTMLVFSRVLTLRPRQVLMGPARPSAPDDFCRVRLLVECCFIAKFKEAENVSHFGDAYFMDSRNTTLMFLIMSYCDDKP